MCIDDDSEAGFNCKEESCSFGDNCNEYQNCINDDSEAGFNCKETKGKMRTETS